MFDVMSWMGLGGGRRTATSERAHELVEQGALLLDVRTRGEFAGGHLPAAVNVPVGELAERTHELTSPARPIVVYCRSGARSASAASQLRRLGLEVHDLGPMSAW